MSWKAAPSCLVLGHRGARLAAPENTLPALELAVHQGADGVEFDVQLSADGVPVVIHDWSVDRTTDGMGNVAELTAAEIQQLDAGNGVTIPTLDEIFDRFKSEIYYNVELKSLSATGDGLEQAVAECITRHAVSDRVLISSFNPLALERMNEAAPRVPLGFLHVGPGKLILPEAPLLAVHPHVNLVDDAYIAWAGGHGYRVHVWTVNDGLHARRLRERGVRAIISDDPQKISEALSGDA